MKVDGFGKRKILIVGEAPGAGEDEKGIPFIGASGAELARVLSGFGVEIRRDCWITNSIICRPEGNRTPTSKEIEYCRPNIIRAVEELNPEVILPLGSSAVNSVIGWLQGEDPGSISRWVGWQIPHQKLNAWICPTWHPSYVLRSNSDGSISSSVLRLLWEEHLKSAVLLEGRPWKKKPDFESQVVVELDTEEAARKIRKITYEGSDRRTSPFVAFDYETDRLKPDSTESRIVSCSVSDGKTTIAYPWYGGAKEATRDLLFSGIPMVASNMKFEERWTIKEFGEGVKNWYWDTMLSTHVLDSRPGITSIKFQAFVLLGQDPWTKGVEEYFGSDGSNSGNRLWKMDLCRLLRYNGLDSLMEWKVAQIHSKEIK
jgi:uracil-DNA glycosylase family 4